MHRISVRKFWYGDYPLARFFIDQQPATMQQTEAIIKQLNGLGLVLPDAAPEPACDDAMQVASV